jgi:hypothetical protein
VREDAGFHLFGFLFVLIVADFASGVPLRAQRSKILFALGSLGYAVCAVLIQNLVLHGGGLFIEEFVGNPPYGHMTWTYLPVRLWQFFKLAPWVPLSALAVLVFAIVDRAPRYLLGYVATTPWILLYAAGQPPYTMGGYRTFPIGLAMVWPMLEMGRRYNFRMKIGPWLWCGSFLVIVCLASAFGFRLTTPFSMFERMATFYQADKKSFADLIDFLASPALEQKYGAIAVDESVMALSPRSMRLEYRNLPERRRIDLFVYWKNNTFLRGVNSTTISEQAFPNGYRVKGTNVLIASRKSLDGDSALAGLLERDNTANRIFPSVFQTASWTEVHGDEVVAVATGTGPMVYGPIMQIPPGAYDANFQVALASSGDKATVALEVASGVRSIRVLKRDELTVDHAGPVANATLRFTIPDEESGKFMQFRVWLVSGALVVKNISIVRAK